MAFPKTVAIELEQWFSAFLACDSLKQSYNFLQPFVTGCICLWFVTSSTNGQVFLRLFHLNMV